MKKESEKPEAEKDPKYRQRVTDMLSEGGGVVAPSWPNPPLDHDRPRVGESRPQWSREPSRAERDALGEVAVPVSRYWGAQTQRSLENFRIGTEHMPSRVVHALALVKWAVARANASLGALDAEKARYIAAAAHEVAEGKLDDHFPLSVFQTGSGTHTNMNVNEVVARRATELAKRDGKELHFHPNDEVNAGQSSNDSFPTATQIAAVRETHDYLLPALRELRGSLTECAREYGAVVKVGRTHYQDAVPLTFGQEIGTWIAQLDFCRDRILRSLEQVAQLPLGGTAIGTGLGAHPKMPEAAVALLAEEVGLPFTPLANKFRGIAAHDSLVALHSDFRGLATVALKLAGDVRFSSSGPRAGISELVLPENEPGSSIMPGKVNPTQAEALAMVAMEVMGADGTVGLAGASGHLQLNVAKPLIAHHLLRSARLLGDVLRSFSRHCVEGMKPNAERIEELLGRNLSLATALNAEIGYDRASEIAHDAHRRNVSLKEAAVDLGYLTAEDFDRIVRPEELVRPRD